MKNNFKIKLGSHTWKVRFLPTSKMVEGNFGTCWSIRRIIEIDDALAKSEVSIILAHELTHALLTVSGNYNTQNYNEEYVCDFIAWNIDTITTIRDDILKKRFN